MKNFISILVLILISQLSAKADNISDFQIENMSIGDSLLEFMSENEINQNILDYFPNQRKYYVVAKINDLKSYEQLEIYLKTDDKQYIIKTLGGFISFSDKKCLVTKKKN